MTEQRSFSTGYVDTARSWFDEVLRAARDVHVIGERRAAEGILLSLDRWFIDRAVVTREPSPLTELTMVVGAILGDDVLRRVDSGVYLEEASVLHNPLGAHITLTFDDAGRLGRAVLAAIPTHAGDDAPGEI
ncbi:hypothetical protein [Microbacterium sp. G2-8]|uniref:hypothetical protein n=1 Tax=Microbacterium sp. G2-8 TaxID=2842454 RepID=UPI001C88E6F7|nr:hypothetical protein [Microbacterium sp. G2-8]